MAANNLQEFYDENLTRSYPLLDAMSATANEEGFSIPTDLIADMRMVVPQGIVAQGTFFISGMVIRRYTLDIEVSFIRDGSVATVVGVFHNIPTDVASFTSFSFTAWKQADVANVSLEDITGIIVMGSGGSLANKAGAWTFDKSATTLVDTVVVEQLTKFRALQIDDELLTGDIILEEGENISITPTYDNVTDTTTIKFSTTKSDTGTLVINNDTDLFDALTAVYGTPITKINNIAPNTSGDFVLAGADCIDVAVQGSGLLLDNPCGTPCCDKDTYLTPVYESVNNLNARHARLDDYLVSVNSSLSLLLNRLKDLENSVGVGNI